MLFTERAREKKILSLELDMYILTLIIFYHSKGYTFTGDYFDFFSVFILSLGDFTLHAQYLHSYLRLLTVGS